MSRAASPFLADLRRRVATRPALPFGLAAIDAALPGGGIALGALHEMGGGGDGAVDGAAAALFAAGIYERQRRIVLGARMLGAHGRIQRAGAVVHLVAHRLIDLSAELAGIGAEGETAPRDPSKTRDRPDPRRPLDALRIQSRNFR